MAFGLSDPTQQIESSVDNLSAAVSAKLGAAIQSAKTTTSVPWTNQKKSRFFPYITIEPGFWDQLFPYRLIVVDVTRGGQIVNGTPQVSAPKVTRDGSRTTLDFVPLGSQWIFQLPITPSQLSISDQFAINTAATLRGVMEEHNGLKFKMISAAGTTGVWPYRESVIAPPGSPSILQSVLGGTLEAASSVTAQFSAVVNVAKGGHPASKPVTKKPEVSTAGSASTGYYSMMAFQQFLEQYAEAKKNPTNAGWRLVFDIPKQNTSYIGTPVAFTWIQNAQKPLEISFQFQFKAWRRFRVHLAAEGLDMTVQSISPGILARILNTVTAARNLCSSSLNLIAAVRSDLEAPLNVLRQTSLLVKDMAGVVTSAADLPSQLAKDYASSIKDSINIAKDAITGTTSDPNVINAVNAIVASSAAVEGLSLAKVAGGQIGSTAAQAQAVDPANNALQNPDANFAL